jgi:hypothetical protein
MLESTLEVLKNDELIEQRHNTPTTTLLTHLADALYSGTNLGTVSKIVLVDDSNNEQDYTTTLTFNVGDTLTIQGTITASRDYNVVKVRTYKGNDLYFESSVSFSVVTNDRIQITITVSISVSGTLSGGTFVLRNFKTYVFQVLAGQLAVSQLSINQVVLGITNLDANEQYNIPLSPTKSKPTATQVSLSVSYTPEYTWALGSVTVKCQAGELYYYVVSLTGNRGTQITYNDTITFSTP